jgi:hypothetical protein
MKESEYGHVLVYENRTMKLNENAPRWGWG